MLWHLWWRQWMFSQDPTDQKPPFHWSFRIGRARLKFLNDARKIVKRCDWGQSAMSRVLQCRVTTSLETAKPALSFSQRNTSFFWSSKYRFSSVFASFDIADLLTYLRK